MEPTESKKSNLCWWDSHISPENSKWLAENLEGKQLFSQLVLFIVLYSVNHFSKLHKENAGIIY